VRHQASELDIVAALRGCVAIDAPPKLQSNIAFCKYSEVAGVQLMLLPVVELADDELVSSSSNFPYGCPGARSGSWPWS
jgi:hypothetical protein